MLLKRNLLESITLISCSGTVICILLTYLTNSSLITGVWFLLYISILFFVSVSLSFRFIQWLLRLNKPVKYDLESFFEDYPCFSFLSQLVPNTKRTQVSEVKEYDTNELSIITSVLERKLVSSWYIPYISQEIGFPFACKQMLDQIISKSFQICNKIENKDVYVDMSTVLVSHFKEYRKALKRHEKTPTHPIVSHYKKIHPISESVQKYSTADHCMNILRIVFKDLVPWELWDTPHSELLVRIMAKKLDSYIDSTLTDPVWLNDKLLNLLNAKSNAKTLGKPDIPKPEVKEAVISPKLKSSDTTSIQTALSTVITKSTAPILQRALNDDEKPVKLEGIVEEKAVISEPVEIRSSPVLRQRRGRQGRNEVKIYDRVIEGSVKTWETDIDLQCISLGQDLLASLDGEMTLSRLWGNEPEAEGSPNPPRCKSPQPLWFGEEDQLDMDLVDTSPQRESRKEQSPKPSETLLKDLQSTVYQAKTKIGDLQVRNVPIDVQRKHNTDEAAGMMEGLLDFGIAGLKKGLRFTGLSDDLQEKSPSHHAKTSDKSPSEVRRSIAEYKETGTTTLLQREENPTAPPLLKQHRVISQDSVPSQAKPVPIVRGEFPAPLVPLPDSPEPVYEEAADLSTSIAKLRCLLQQRAQAPRSDDIWWESAEETRGRIQSHHSTKPVDTATLADEYDMNIDRNSSPGQTSNNMQRLDK